MLRRGRKMNDKTANNCIQTLKRDIQQAGLFASTNPCSLIQIQYTALETLHTLIQVLRLFLRP
jgi:hypothetical protein